MVRIHCPVQTATSKGRVETLDTRHQVLKATRPSFPFSFWVRAKRGWCCIARAVSEIRALRRLLGCSGHWFCLLSCVWIGTGLRSTTHRRSTGQPLATRGSCDRGTLDPLVSSGMKVIGVLVVFTSCLIAPAHSSFWQFQRMVKHITGRSAFFSYYGYGCYCGLGGKGTPVDDTDRCCLAHDCCYEKLKQLGCQPLLSSYQFRIFNGTVVCECALGPSVGCLCGLRACECDKRSSYCFKENLPTYEKNFKQFFLSRPRCGRRKVQC